MQQNIYTEGDENRDAKSNAPNSFSVWFCNILLIMPSVAKDFYTEISHYYLTVHI